MAEGVRTKKSACVKLKLKSPSLKEWYVYFKLYVNPNAKCIESIFVLKIFIAHLHTFQQIIQNSMKSLFSARNRFVTSLLFNLGILTFLSIFITREAHSRFRRIVPRRMREKAYDVPAFEKGLL